MDFGASVSALTSLPLDWIIFAVIVLIISADSVRSGPAHACALALAFPIALFLFQQIPQTILIGSLDKNFQALAEQAALFAILVVLLFLCFNEMLYAFDKSTSLLFSGLAGFAATIVIITIWLQTPALMSLWHFDPQMQGIFGSSYRLFWLLGAYACLAFAS